MRGIVTLCGSVRFRSDFDRINHVLSGLGWIVLAPGVWNHEHLHTDAGAAQKKLLDAVYREKIGLSDTVIMINRDAYVGESSRGELEYARSLQKAIYWMESQPGEPVGEESWMTLVNLARKDQAREVKKQ